MVTPELVEYIRTRKNQGASDEQIRQELAGQGWQDYDISAGLSSANGNSAAADAMSTVAAPGKKSPFTTLKYWKFRMGHKFFLLVALIVLVLLGSGVGVWYLNFMTPEKHIGRMIENLTHTKTFVYKGNSSVEITFPKPDQNDPAMPDSSMPYFSFTKPIKITSDFSGTSDISDKTTPKGTMNIAAALTGSIINIEGKFQTINIGNDAYIKFNELPDLGFVDFTPILDKWIDLESTEEEGDTSGEFTPEVQEQLIQFMQQNQTLEVTERLSSSTINGKSSTGYAFRIQPEKVGELLTEYYRLTGESITDDYKENMDEFISHLEPATGEMWIGTWDANLYKLSVNLNLKQSDELPVSVAVRINSTFSDYNKTLAIEKPSKTITMDELNSLMFSNYPNPYPEDDGIDPGYPGYPTPLSILGDSSSPSSSLDSKSATPSSFLEIVTSLLQ